MSRRGAIAAMLRGRGPALRRSLSAGAILSDYATINGITVKCAGSAGWRYDGHRASATAWPATRGSGDDLANDGAGAAITIETGVPIEGTAPRYNNGDYHKGVATSGIMPGALEDFLLRVLLLKTSTTGRVAGNRSGAPAGLDLYETAAGELECYMDDDTNFAWFQAGATITAGDYVLMDLFCDRDEASTNGCMQFISGALSGSGIDASALTGSLDSAVPLGLGGWAGAGDYQGVIVHASLFRRADWFAGGAQNATDWAAYAVAEMLPLPPLN